jgi:DNA-binding transcriptional regulator YiaG|tara:strand:- start:8887 stop:9084 length:198 start_codon:yes stop_codon:yes gene_type:complete
MNLGKSLKVALAASELKNKDFAEMFDVSASQVSKWITTGRISLANQLAISKALNLKVSEFIAMGE